MRKKNPELDLQSIGTSAWLLIYKDLIYREYKDPNLEIETLDFERL